MKPEYDPGRFTVMEVWDNAFGEQGHTRLMFNHDELSYPCTGSLAGAKVGDVYQLVKAGDVSKFTPEASTRLHDAVVEVMWLESGRVLESFSPDQMDVVIQATITALIAEAEADSLKPEAEYWMGYVADWLRSMLPEGDAGE